MNLSEHRKANIYELADIERAVKGKIYPAGCTLIPLSAATSTPNKLTTDEGEIETRYAVVQPHIDVNPVYLFAIIEREYPHFKAKYMTTINLQFGQLKNLEVEYHPNKKTQNRIAELLEAAEKLSKKEKYVIEKLKKEKAYFLGTMFAINDGEGGNTND